MSIFKLFPPARGFRPWRIRLLTGLLAAGVLPVHAQTDAGNPRPVRLSLVAVDSAGNPVPDLTASDFAVVDNGSPQQIVSLQLNRSDHPRPLVVLFDLMNASEVSRGAVWNTLKTSLAHLPSTGPLYLYLLVADGTLYPVHALPATPGTQAADTSWVNDIGPLLDAAMQKVNEAKPLEFRASSPTSLQARFQATFGALDEMRAQMSRVSGPKELLWVTYGIPSTIHFVDRTWFYGAPILRQLGARFVQSGITVYTADPGLNLQRGILDRDALDILTGATGGFPFSSIELGRAITRIEADSRAIYSVEYQPAAANWDGKYHKLRVTVARKGVHIQTERGYDAL